MNSELIDLEDDDEFSSFEGPLYVGGAPKNLLSNSDVRTGFIGCLRGLVLNDKVVNLNKHVHRKYEFGYQLSNFRFVTNSIVFKH